MHTSRSPRFRHLIALYKSAAILTLNTILVFIAVNVAAAALLRLLPNPELQGALRYDLDRLSRVYPDLQLAELRTLLEETWSRTYEYEPFTQFRERPFSGRFVNVSSLGFRETGHAVPWPPDSRRINIFVFGGSTTFGYGVADHQTIPARMHEVLNGRCDQPAAVYNMARSNYYSSQEAILFLRLLAGGDKPTAAVFIDGLNEFGHANDEPKFTQRLRYLMNETGAQSWRRVLVTLPVARLIKRTVVSRERSQRLDVAPHDAQSLVDRWLLNREQIRAVADRGDIETLFVWQPVPDYAYDSRHHLFAPDSDSQSAARAQGYSLMDRLRTQPSSTFGKDFLWLADIQETALEPLYVDRVHYSAEFSTHIATRIADMLANRLCTSDS